MSRLSIDILGFSEVRWPGSGKQEIDKGTIYYSGANDTNHGYGTAITMINEIAKSVIEIIPLNDRIMIIKIETSHRILNITQLYAPTNDKTDRLMLKWMNFTIIDYRSDFDCVKQENMIQKLRTTGIDAEEIKIISELY